MTRLAQLAAASLLGSILMGTWDAGQALAAINRADERATPVREARKKRAADQYPSEESAQRSPPSDYFAPSARGGRADMLAESGLKIGDQLPNVLGYDAEGKRFRLGSLKGHFSVLVFGCLT